MADVSQCDSLESRTLLSGGVTAEVVGDALRIFGDDANNDVEVFHNSGQGQFVVVGRGGTTINGQETALIDADQVQEIRVFLRQGNDVFEFDGGTAPQLRSVLLNAGLGDDSVELRNAQVRDFVDVYGGAGADTLNFVGNTFDGSLNVFAQGGNDQIVVDRSVVAGGVLISGGQGADQIDVRENQLGSTLKIRTDGGTASAVLISNNVVGGSVSILGGEGRDGFAVEGLVTDGNLIMSGRDGQDAFLIRDSIIANITSIRGQGGSDVVYLTDRSGDGSGVFHPGSDRRIPEATDGANVFGNDLRVFGGSETDVVQVVGVHTFESAVRLDGNLGNDRLSIVESQAFPVAPEVIGFEVVTAADNVPTIVLQNRLNILDNLFASFIDEFRDFI